MFNSCKKEDKSASPNSNSGSTSPVDKCAGITCYNGGTCTDGICQCPQGYGGTYCENQVTPSHMTISKITVTNFNQNGDPDDVLPDIYIKLKNGNTVMYNSPTYYNNATSPGNYNFIPASPISINPSGTYTVELWDSDTVSDDFLELAVFSAYTGYSGFPQYITATYLTFSCKVYVSYSW